MPYPHLERKEKAAGKIVSTRVSRYYINPLRPNSDLSQTSHCNMKGLSVS